MAQFSKFANEDLATGAVEGGKIAEAFPAAGTWLPELSLMMTWLAFLLLFFFILEFKTHTDFLVYIVVHVLCLPIISRKTTPRLLACLGASVCGMIFGMQLIDLVFDLAIVDGRKEIAYWYYNEVVFAPHINAVVMSVILITNLGAQAGLIRTTSLPQLRKIWISVGAKTTIGAGVYLVFVVPRYIRIRASSGYVPELFDGWHPVIYSRVVLFASIVAIMPELFDLQGRCK